MTSSALNHLGINVTELTSRNSPRSQGGTHLEAIIKLISKKTYYPGAAAEGLDLSPRWSGLQQQGFVWSAGPLQRVTHYGRDYRRHLGSLRMEYLGAHLLRRAGEDHRGR